MSEDGKRRGKYLGFVAHEIKNPLATALWSCELLQRMDAADRAGPRAERMVDALLRSLRRMRRLVDDHFTIERLLLASYELRSERLSIPELLRSALEKLPDAKVALEVPSLEVRGDPEMLTRGLRVLLEHLGGEGGVSAGGRAHPEGGVELLLRPLGARAAPLLPPPPEERPSGDPLGMVLSFSLAQEILKAHGAKLTEQDGALAVWFPAA